jgi:hypothetical protein
VCSSDLDILKILNFVNDFDLVIMLCYFMLCYVMLCYVMFLAQKYNIYKTNIKNYLNTLQHYTQEYVICDK